MYDIKLSLLETRITKEIKITCIIKMCFFALFDKID